MKIIYFCQKKLIQFSNEVWIIKSKNYLLKKKIYIFKQIENNAFYFYKEGEA